MSPGYSQPTFQLPQCSPGWNFTSSLLAKVKVRTAIYLFKANNRSLPNRYWIPTLVSWLNTWVRSWKGGGLKQGWGAAPRERSAWAPCYAWKKLSHLKKTTSKFNFTSHHQGLTMFGFIKHFQSYIHSLTDINETIHKWSCHHMDIFFPVYDTELTIFTLTIWTKWIAQRSITETPISSFYDTT